MRHLHPRTPTLCLIAVLTLGPFYDSQVIQARGTGSLTASIQRHPAIPWPPDDSPPATSEASAWARPSSPIPASATAEQQANAFANESAMVFQSFRDGNWEIYRADGSGQSAMRLTAHAAADIEPRLSLDGSKVVFTSRRDSNYEVYAMNIDGSNLRRLTAHAATDAAPSWSPDGTRIVFVSDRDGNPEIFTMNADGTGVTQLTQTNGGLNLYPAWSPIGNFIAWVQYNPSATLRDLYTMQANGQEQHHSTVQCAYLGRLRWSPDAKQLAYDCDRDSDDWNELVIADVIKTEAGPVWIATHFGNQRTAYDPGRNLVDAALEGWSPDGKSLLFSQLHWTVNSNSLTLANYDTYAIEIATSQRSELGEQTHLDRFFDWRWQDRLPPISKLQPPPQYLRVNQSIDVAWSGADNGPAGIIAFDIQYKLDDGAGGAWTDWLLGIQDISNAVLPVSGPGLTVSVRGRARDAAGNIEPWPPEPGDISVNVYQLIIKGMVSDIRNQPLSGASVALIPTFKSQPVQMTDSSGSYQAYATTTDKNHVLVSKLGYGVVPNSYFNTYSNISLSYPDGIFNPYLYPHDNVIVNSSLEEGTLTPTGWRWFAQTPPFGLEGQFMGRRSVSFYPAFSGCGSRCIEQTVTISSTLHKPTLSFAYRANYGIQPHDNNFLVSVTDELTTTHIFTGPQASTPWARVWFDMQPWVGKTITITFGSVRGGITGQLFVDDVSLGTWGTPGISSVSVPDPPVAGTIITITGTNFIPTPTVRLNAITLGNVQWLSDTQLLAEMPANMPPGIYELSVSNVGGAMSVLPNVMKVGNQVYLPMTQQNN